MANQPFPISADGHALVSVVTPVFNAASFLPAAFECMFRQTLREWEWVIVDDGSTDGSLSLLRSLAGDDKRVRIVSQPHYGSAKYARDHAISLVSSGWVLSFDADDVLADDYLELMLRRQQETQADIVYPRMVFVDDASCEQTQVLPVEGFNASEVYQGRDLVVQTLPDWHIGCNGGLYRRSLLTRLSFPRREQPLWMNSDEVDERYYLLAARRVAFATAGYFYRVHAQSLTNAFSPKLFETLQTDIQLLDLCEQHFGLDSDEWLGAHRIAFNDWRAKQKLLLTRNHLLESAEPLVWQWLAQLFSRLDASRLSLSERLRWLNLFDFRGVMFLRGLMLSPRYIVGKVVERISPRLYLQRFVRPGQKRRTEQALTNAYAAMTSGNSADREYARCVVCLFEGNHSGGGLVDRLRGIVSAWQVCRQQGLDLRVHFVHPFPLTDYLLPADHDWRITESELTHAPSQTEIIVADSLSDQPWERRWLLKQLTNRLLQHPHLQRHLYTNAAFCYDAGFRQLFGELFKPSPRLEDALNKILQQIGTPFITVSARFGNLLDDFNEQNYGCPLPPDERQLLLDACEQKTMELHQQHPDAKVVVCSDSLTFNSLMQSQPFVFIIPGTVTHIDNDTCHDDDHYLKTFLDLFVIAHADHSYLLRSQTMLMSGFPYAASLLGGRQLELVSF